MKATRVDGVYSDDPAKNPKARRFKSISHQDAIQKKLKIMDTSALALCQEHRLPIRVFDMTVPGNIRRALRGDSLGTLLGN